MTVQHRHGVVADAAPRLDILIADDEPSVATPLAGALRDHGYRVDVVHDGRSALTRIDSRVYDVVISDVRLPDVDGLEILRQVREKRPRTAVVLMSAYGTIREAVHALRANAIHYLPKPFDLGELLDLMQETESEQSKTMDPPCGLEGPPIIGVSGPMVALKNRVRSIANSDTGVLITGESGTGKEILARSLHANSSRRDNDFVAVNCAAFPDTLLESELFGYERGAFTGAQRSKPGRLAMACGGTLFLDEVAEMSATAQVALLRVLQERTFEPLGSNATTTFDTRVIAATNANLEQRVAQGLFREDLYYRLKVFHLTLPPLRDRMDDLPLLVRHFQEQLAERTGRAPAPITPSTWAALASHHWRGNVRELAHALEHAEILACGAPLEVEHLPEEITGRTNPGQSKSRNVLPLATAVEEFESQYLRHVLQHANNKKLRAAKLLRISRKTLWMKLRRHGIAAEGGDRGAA